MKKNATTSNDNETVDPELQQLGEHAMAAAAVAVEFFSKLCVAARKDGRTLDPLWSDLATAVVVEQDGDANKRAACYHTTKLVLSQSDEMDVMIYREFRSHFPTLSVQSISDNDTAAAAAAALSDKDAWTLLRQRLSAETQHMNDDSDDYYNATTLLRPDALDMFWMTHDSVSSEGDILVVPRLQFLCIEVCRVKEGWYDRSFRRVLEVFDLKTQADRLDSSLERVSLEDMAMDALQLLRTQWPNPSHSALKRTQIVPLLQTGAREGCSERVRSNCQELLDYWKDVQELGKIAKVLQQGGDGGDQSRRLRPVMEKAGAAFVNNRLDQHPHQQQQHKIDLNDDDPTPTPNNSSEQQQKVEETQVQREMVGNSKSIVLEDLTFPDHANSDEIAKVFREQGVVVLLGRTNAIEECAIQAKAALDALLEKHPLEPCGLQLDDVAANGGDFVETRKQLPGQSQSLDNQRILLDDTETDSPIAILGRQLEQEVPKILFPGEEDDFRLDGAGVLQSFSQKHSDSDWHREGSSLFSNHHHDAHSFTAFIPLVDLRVGSVNHKFEFMPGTHVDEIYTQVAPNLTKFAEQDPTAKHDRAMRPAVSAGMLVALDDRLLRRAFASNPQQDPPILFFTFARKWLAKETPKPSQSMKPLNEDHVVYSKLLVLSRLSQLLTRNVSPRLLSRQESFGHPFFTERFELLLLEGFLSDDEQTQSTAMANMAAVIHFCKLSEGDKETTAREFSYNLGDQAHERKERALRKTRSKRQKYPEPKKSGATSSAVSTTANPSNSTALCDLTTTIIMEESILLSKLGFTCDEDGISVLLAMLKAHAARDSLGCIGITAGKLEEVFTAWWYAPTDRFSFYPGHATSPEEQSTKKVLVIFCSLDLAGIVATDWGAIVLKATTSNPTLDVMQVLDPASSFFCQDPDCQWLGCDYYISELEEMTSSYQSVMFLGNSSGASASLRFSSLANRVLAFSPQITISTCTTALRTDFPESVPLDFQEQLLECAKTTDAAITVHYARGRKDQLAQLKLLPKRKDIELVAHEFDGLDLFSHLKFEGSLSEIVDTAIADFAGPTTPRRSKKICSGTLSSSKWT